MVPVLPTPFLIGPKFIEGAIDDPDFSVASIGKKGFENSPVACQQRNLIRLAEALGDGFLCTGEEVFLRFAVWRVLAMFHFRFYDVPVPTLPITVMLLF